MKLYAEVNSRNYLQVNYPSRWKAYRDLVKANDPPSVRFLTSGKDERPNDIDKPFTISRSKRKRLLQLQKRWVIDQEEFQEPGLCKDGSIGIRPYLIAIWIGHKALAKAIAH